MKHADPNYDTLAEREIDLGISLDRLVDDYNGTDDFAKSIELAYELIRERMAKGGPGWQQKEYRLK